MNGKIEAPDTILETDPEPCDDCPKGLAFIVRCFDGKRRCYDCVHAYAKRRGWDR